MANILSSDDFGLKIYNRFPPAYIEDDSKQKFALKRYLQVLGEGGFKYSIDEINGLTSLIDPNKASKEVLILLLKQHGLEVFNGIPEPYLRYLLPIIGEIWSKKGSIESVEYLSSSISGIKTNTEITYDEDGNPIVDIRLEMDYNIGDYIPDTEQLSRIIQNFLPFFADFALIYSYLFTESGNLIAKDTLVENNVVSIVPETGVFSKDNPSTDPEAILAEFNLGELAFGTKNEDLTADYEDNIKVTPAIEDLHLITYPDFALTNNEHCTTNETFYTNSLSNYDIVRVGGIVTRIFY